MVYAQRDRFECFSSSPLCPHNTNKYIYRVDEIGTRLLDYAYTVYNECDFEYLICYAFCLMGLSTQSQNKHNMSEL